MHQIKNNNTSASSVLLDAQRKICVCMHTNTYVGLAFHIHLALCVHM